MSGGSTVRHGGALCAPFRTRRTLALLMPEADSYQTDFISVASLPRPSTLRPWWKTSPILPAAGPTDGPGRIANLVPGDRDGWKFKIVLPSVLGPGGYHLFPLVVQSPSGETVKVRLPARGF